MRELEGAIATSMRPYGLGPRPFETSLHVLPPSAERSSALPLVASAPSPPERNVHPLRRKSHSAAKRTSGLPGSIERLEHPVERFGPRRICDQVLPPSSVLKRPRSAESLHSFPGTQAYTTLPFFGCTTMRATRSDSRSPMLVQVSPPSVER